MASRISRARIINRRTSQHRAVDPAQCGWFTARLSPTGRLAIMAAHNQLVMRSQGVLAAKWEASPDETILLVLREAAEDEPVVVRAFKPRIGREWQMEDAHAVAIPSPNGEHVAVLFTLPNAAVAVLPAGRVVQNFLVRANLSGPGHDVAWSDDGVLSVSGDGSVLTWRRHDRQFRKAAG